MVTSRVVGRQPNASRASYRVTVSRGLRPGQGGRIGAVEREDASAAGSVGHVEVFQMASVRTPIFARPRRPSRDRHGNARYTLIGDEPLWVGDALDHENSLGVGDKPLK